VTADSPCDTDDDRFPIHWRLRRNCNVSTVAQKFECPTTLHQTTQIL